MYPSTRKRSTHYDDDDDQPRRSSARRTRADDRMREEHDFGSSSDSFFKSPSRPSRWHREDKSRLGTLEEEHDFGSSSDSFFHPRSRRTESLGGGAPFSRGRSGAASSMWTDREEDDDAHRRALFCIPLSASAQGSPLCSMYASSLPDGGPSDEQS